jgi:hypothetical protein
MFFSSSPMTSYHHLGHLSRRLSAAADPGGRGKLRAAHRPHPLQGDMVGLLQGISGIPDFLVTGGTMTNAAEKPSMGVSPPSVSFCDVLSVDNFIYLTKNTIKLWYGLRTGEVT